jgi:hypothetical protein
VCVGAPVNQFRTDAVAWRPLQMGSAVTGTD